MSVTPRKGTPTKATNPKAFYWVPQALLAATKNDLSFSADVTHRPAQYTMTKHRFDQARELQIKQHCWADASRATARKQAQVSPNMGAAIIGAPCVEPR